jgi:hypothetical protein
MNNEPVAWYNADDSSLSFKNHGGGWQPLYTHPAKTPTLILDGNRVYPAFKELTDEELESWITAWAKDLYGSLYVEPTDHQRTMAIKMARAILRKAQEK